jgi:hypothetical protein
MIRRDNWILCLSGLGTVTRLWEGGSGVQIQAGTRDFFFEASRRALGPIEPAIQLVLEFFLEAKRSEREVIIIIIIIIIMLSLVTGFLPGTSLEPAVISTAQASSFTLQYFPCYV